MGAGTANGIDLVLEGKVLGIGRGKDARPDQQATGRGGKNTGTGYRSERSVNGQAERYHCRTGTRPPRRKPVRQRAEKTLRPMIRRIYPEIRLPKFAASVPHLRCHARCVAVCCARCGMRCAQGNGLQSLRHLRKQRRELRHRHGPDLAAADCGRKHDVQYPVLALLVPADLAQQR